MNPTVWTPRELVERIAELSRSPQKIIAEKHCPTFIGPQLVQAAALPGWKTPVEFGRGAKLDCAQLREWIRDQAWGGCFRRRLKTMFALGIPRDVAQQRLNEWVEQARQPATRN